MTSAAEKTLRECLNHRQRFQARLRLAEAEVVQEKQNAGLAMDRVLGKESVDAKRENAMLAETRIRS